MPKLPEGIVSLVGAIVVAGLVLVVRFALLDKGSAMWIESYWGYYFVLAALAWLTFSIWRIKSEMLEAIKLHRRQCAVAAAVVILCSVFLHLHEPHMLRVLHDEPSHIAGSLMMHEERMAVMPMKAHRLFGDLIFLDKYPSFRLYLFQVLLSILHDTTGYRPENVFWLNGGLTVILLGLLYRVGVMFAGGRGGVVAVLLLTSIPLVAQNVTSGSYDVLNLVLILALFLASCRYLSRAGAEGLDLMLSVGVILSLARYESIVYLTVPIAAALIKWCRERRVTLTPMAIVSPLFVLPNLIANFLMVHTDEFMLSHIRQGKVRFFDIAHIPGNLREAVFYFYNFDTGASNSILVAVLGAVAVVLFYVSFLKQLFERRAPFDVKVGLLGLLIAIVAGLYLVTLSNFWGMPTDPAAARFSLPLQLTFVLASVWLMGRCFRAGRLHASVVGAVALYVGLVTVPANAKHTVTDMMLVAQSNKWFVDYAKHHDRGRTLYVSASNMSLLINHLPSVYTKVFNGRLLEAAQSLRAGFYDEVLIHEMFWIRSEDGRLQTNFTEPLSQEVVVEVVAEQKFHPRQVSRIVRFKGLKRADGTLRPEDELPSLRTSFSSDAEQAKYLIGLLP